MLYIKQQIRWKTGINMNRIKNEMMFKRYAIISFVLYILTIICFIYQSNLAFIVLLIAVAFSINAYKFCALKNGKYDEALEKAKEDSDTAVFYARSFRKRLDYSISSINDLEDILDFYANDIRGSNLKEEEIRDIADLFGAYLGETMLKNGLLNKGYKWIVDSDLNTIYLSDNQKAINPNEKVFARLVKGKDEEIVSYFKEILKVRLN